ncbi:aminotransferase [Lentzea sp. NBRC 105346]|uniref:pyridoxal phosphate-dependent aminotransferase n=1 Tax=Lentzea sp. NBRC 105346 TaxID=3032205 RepID=UPI0024A32BCF|nr:pyridoxal phosphate-dependent aminotransferase [Lentzea sp. NBRC 105346]GLZ27980.1 aminotransferase [Lentzea sp. NBRC 105346]
MSRTSARAGLLGGSGLVELLRRSAGMDAVDLALGVPGVPAPPAGLVAAAGFALLRGDHHQYADPAGHPLLRQRIADSLGTEEDEITVTVGSTEGLAVALLSLVDPGDEVIMLEPYYENFVNAVLLAGGVPRFVRLHRPGWCFDSAELAAAFGPRTRAMIVNSPGNPTGRVFSGAELDEIAALCEKWDVTVVSDEVYSSYVFEGVHTSAADVPALRDRYVIVDSLSKSHAVSGWRLGYLRAPKSLTTVLRRVHEATTAGAAAPLQLAAARALPREWFPAEEMRRRRDTVARLFAECGLAVDPGQGGVFLTAGLGGADSRSFARQLLERTGVLVAPGSLFVSEDHRGDFVRVAFNRTREVLDTAATRLRKVAACPG